MINKDKRKYFTAGELAAIFNISKQSLLYYDKVNLLSPKMATAIILSSNFWIWR